MKRCLGLLGIAGALAGGCRDTSGPLLGQGDARLGGGGDAALLLDGAAAPDGGDDDGGMGAPTIHDIDTGVVANGAMVKLSGVVVIGFARTRKTTANKCRYTAYVQDPDGPAPSGIELFLESDTCAGSPCKCPLTPDSKTPYDQIPVAALGATVTVTGKVSNFTVKASDAGPATVQHELVPTSIEVTGMDAKVTPVRVSDPAQIESFGKGGVGYQMYESMLVTIAPAMPEAVANLDKFGEYDFAGAHFTNDYDFNYKQAGEVFPMDGDSFGTLTGIAEPAFGGAIAPREKADFVAAQ